MHLRTYILCAAKEMLYCFKAICKESLSCSGLFSWGVRTTNIKHAVTYCIHSFICLTSVRKMICRTLHLHFLINIYFHIKNLYYYLQKILKWSLLSYIYVFTENGSREAVLLSYAIIGYLRRWCKLRDQVPRF